MDPCQREHLEEHCEVFQKWCLCLTCRCGFRLPEFLHQLRRKLLADVLAGVLAGPLVGVRQVPLWACPAPSRSLEQWGLPHLTISHCSQRPPLPLRRSTTSRDRFSMSSPFLSATISQAVVAIRSRPPVLILSKSARCIAALLPPLVLRGLYGELDELSKEKRCGHGQSEERIRTRRRRGEVAARVS
jgi:hypothetical protein